MGKKKYLILLVLFLIFYGCGEDKLPVVDPPVEIPSCVGAEKSWTSRVDIMAEHNETKFDIYWDNGGVNPFFAFKKKGKIDISYGTKSWTTVAYSIPRGDFDPDLFSDACEELSNQYRGPYLNYVMGLDNFLYVPISTLLGWSNGPNHPGNWSNWSFIFSGKIQSIYGANNNGYEVVEWCYAHEVAHQIAVVEHEPHTGNDAGHCIMKGEYESGILTRFQFCDGHICAMYNQLFDNGVNKNVGLNNNFSCEINLDKTEYIEGESIWASIKIKNESSYIDSLPYATANFLIAERLLKVMNESGKICSYHGSSGPLANIPYKHFKPFSDTTFHFEIINNFGPQFEDSYDYGSMISYFLPGNYSIKFVLEKMNLISNTISYKVIAPDEAEEERLSELRAIYATKDRKERIEKYNSFIENNKGSVYIPQTIWILNRCNNYLYLRGIPLDKNVYDVNKYFLDNYSNSFYSSYIIRIIWKYVYQQSKSETKANDSLREIMQLYPGTVASKMAEYWLNSEVPLKELEPKKK